MLEGTKCDISMVSRKAEREYVDACVDKLKKEVAMLAEHNTSKATNAIRDAADHLAQMVDDKADRIEVRR